MSTNIRELAEQYNDYIIERRRYYHSCPGCPVRRSIPPKH